MEIQEIQVLNDLAIIYAYIDDMILVQHSNEITPAEYKPGLCTTAVDISDIPAWLPLNQMSLIEQIPVLEKYVNLEKLEWTLIEDEIEESTNDTY
jgi:hypothetical protein